MALAACSNDDENNTTASQSSPTEQTEPTPQQSPITFDLTADHEAMTRAIKADWEEGDVIFVFFDNVAAPKFLKMTYGKVGDVKVWTSAEYDGATATPGALGLKNGDSGTMRAVFLPFGSAATVSANGTNFEFSKTYYTYYLTATLDYTVDDNKVSGAFDMIIPADYVQFFVDDASATDEAYSLTCDNYVVPVGVASIAADGTVVETTDKATGAEMLGYAYGFGNSRGYLFSGKLTGEYNNINISFAKKKMSDSSILYYSVTGKTLLRHKAIKLPANGDAKWVSGS